MPTAGRCPSAAMIRSWHKKNNKHSPPNQPHQLSPLHGADVVVTPAPSFLLAQHVLHIFRHTCLHTHIHSSTFKANSTADCVCVHARFSAKSSREELQYVTSVSGAGTGRWMRVKDHSASAICQAGWVE